MRVRQRGRQLEVLRPQDSDAESRASDDPSWGDGEEIAEELDAMLARFGLEKEETFSRRIAQLLEWLGPRKNRRR